MITLDPALLAAIAATEGRIATLIKISLATGSLRYTSWGSAVTYAGETYSPRAQEPGDVMSQASQTTGEMSVSIDDVDGGALRSAAMQKGLKGRDIVISFCMIDDEGGIVAGGDGVLVFFRGRIKQAAVDLQNIDISAEGMLGRQHRRVPPDTFGPQCRHEFREDRCGYDDEDAEKTAQTVDAGSTTTVVADAARTEAADWWAGGWIVFTSGALLGIEERIKSSASGSITLENPLDSAPAAGVTYDIYQGCDRAYSTCVNKFSNGANFGGFVSLAEIDVRA